MQKNKYQYNILYFHGLDSSLSDEKRVLLEQFGRVTGPTYDYRNVEVLKAIGENFDELPDDTVFIGSSFGGYLANLYSLGLDFPCLLFNPALMFRSVNLYLEEPIPKDITSMSYVVLGKQDDVIKYQDTLDFIKEHFKGPKEIYIEEHMGHRTPIDIFEKHLKSFFEYLDEYRGLFEK